MHSQSDMVPGLQKGTITQVIGVTLKLLKKYMIEQLASFANDGIERRARITLPCVLL
jgi:hypothetical protein